MSAELSEQRGAVARLRARSSSTRSGGSTPQTQPFSDDSQTCMRIRAMRSSRSVGGWRSAPCIAPVMISVMISVTLRTMSAFSTAAEPNARTIAAVTSG